MVSTGFVSMEEFQAILPNLQQNVKTVHHTLENLLQWSYSQMQGIKSSPKQVDIQLIVVENIELFAEVAKNKQIVLSYAIPLDTFVFADENQVRLILRNLLNNAIKFTRKNGTINVSAKQNESFIEISVNDTGIGMSEVQVEKLFSIGINSTYGTSGEKGTGLGLMLCKEMAEENKGKIWVESELGKGSTFTVSLPIFYQF
jgi:signal transduction histidine kinase